MLSTPPTPTASWCSTADGRHRALLRTGMTPARTHLLMSVSKSVTATVAGILAGRGRSTRGAVTAMSPSSPARRARAHGAAPAGHARRDPVQRGVRRPRRGRARLRADLPVAAAHRRRAARGRVHVLRRARERRAPRRPVRLPLGPHGRARMGGRARAAAPASPTLIAREVWRPMGAEFDAEVTVDAHGNAMADGGVCATLRDLARFGLLCRRRRRRGRPRSRPGGVDRGHAGRRRGQPRGLRRGCRPTPPPVRAASTATSGGWWTLRPGLRRARHQRPDVFVHPPAGLVVAKFSTWPGADDAALDRITDAAVRAIAAHLA